MRRLLQVVFGLALLAYAVDLGGSSIWDANEAYYVETPREMLESGDYINPAFNYEPRFNKPVLSYWIVAALYHLFGVSVTVQRVAITVFALLMVGAAFLLGRACSRLPMAGLLAAAGLAVNPRFFMFARRILVDMALTSLMTLILACFVMAERYPHRRRTWLVAMYVMVGLGVLAKGPVAAALPALVFLIYLAVYRELGRLRDMMIPSGTMIALAIAAPWYVALYFEGGWAHISEFFIGENLERYTSLVGSQSRGPFFYLPVMFTDGLPWSLCLPGAAVMWWRDRRADPSRIDVRLRTLLLLWTGVIVVFFSLSQTKQDLYIFPIVAAVAALGGDLVARGLEGAAASGGRWSRSTVFAAAVLFGLLGAAVVYAFSSSGTVYAIDGTRTVGAIGIIGSLLVAALTIARRAGLAAVALLATLTAFNWTLILCVLPSLERYKPVVPFSRAIQERIQEGDLVAHYDVALPSMVYYLRRHIDVIIARDEFLAVMRSGRRVFAVLPDDEYESLKHELPAPTCVLATYPTFDAKLREVLSGQPPPAVVLVSTRCET
jgi:4-amino-4-deoxy-L-arabinose transferase-like glycosyltransferase